MAVFFKNDCKYNGCGKSFSTLSSLIEHIEGTHLDFDPKVSAGFELQRPSALPLSYILKYSQSPVSSIDEAEIVSESESSNDSWTPTKGISFKKKPKNLPYKEKPYGCSVPGCKKRYKNINGIKYHCKNGHRHFEKLKKMSNRKSKFSNNGKILLKKIDHLANPQFPSTSNSSGLIDLPTINGKRTTTENMRNQLIENGDDQIYGDNNNMYYPVDFALSCQNDFNKWSNSVSNTNDLTIIRSNLKNTETL
ncbi:hypothetical protein RN001_006187 [Aquatica leii]|uniref:C2H2-type domain-containing protein n=1 Tax=Aquatica leii TaxID=1421715 RepID=A0AAN7SQ45_9COLE|nr:hypothetical protein RN001_006187 [Aquatica leii]